MKRNAVTLLGVVAIVAVIAVVRANFEQTIATEEQAQAAEEAKTNLAEAAEITEAEKAAEAAAATTPEVTEPQEIDGFKETEWPSELPDSFHVKFETTAGPFVVVSHENWAPLGHERFYELCKTGFFDDSGFFRVVPGFVVQFGLASDPKMTAQFKNKRLPDDPVRKSNQPGKITFATSGPNSRTTQLFINYGDNANLDNMGFSPFGEVVAGMANVEGITSEYGEQPQQGMITNQGTEYLKRSFPNMDFIQRVVMVEPAESSAPAEPVEEPAAQEASAES